MHACWRGSDRKLLSDQIYNPKAGQNLMPWVPTEDGFTWGYTSVPPDAVDWWRNLPTRLIKESEDLRHDYEVASGNTVTDQDVILDENGRFLGMYDHDFAKEYISYGEE